MKQKIDSDKGRHIYSQRLGTVEPVCGNINTMIGFKRFGLRGKSKVNAQWQLITLVHNVLKIHRYGWQWWINRAMKIAIYINELKPV